MFDFAMNCRTTAMGIMPHTDVGRAVALALSLDIPFWPQLPNVSFFEDMYVQTSQNFPGITVDMENRKLNFSTVLFHEQINDYAEKMDRPETFALGDDYSVVYRYFMEQPLSQFVSIRGQVTGPVSFGFRVTDENNTPIIYNDAVRPLLFDFIRRKSAEYCRDLRQKNPNAFVWMDEPGLGWVFSGLSGYTDVPAAQEYRSFLGDFEYPRALHLCASVNLPYLLGLGVEMLSFDAYQMGVMPKGYTAAVADFIRQGGAVAWGIVPTDSDSLYRETAQTLAERLSQYWRVIEQNTGVTAKEVAARSLLAPARCCLKNSGSVGAQDDSAAACPVTPAAVTEVELVERAFAILPELSGILRDRYGLAAD